HADHHRLRVEHAGHGGDIAEHPADEGVHDLERGDVDEHGAGPGGDDPLGEIVLEGGGETIVHVHLDGHQEVVAHLEDRDALHGSGSGALVDAGNPETGALQ